MVEESNVQRVDCPVTVSTCLTPQDIRLLMLLVDLWRHPWSILRSERVIQGKMLYESAD